MKLSLLLYAFIFSSSILIAQSSPQNEASIKSIIKHQETAWNRHDWKSFSNYFTENGTLINFVGQFWKNRNEILMNFTQINDCCLSATSLQFEVTKIRFLTPDIAVVYIEETLLTEKDYDTPFQKFKKGDTDYKIISDVFVKTGDDWAITAMQVALINQLITPHKVEKK